MTKNPPAKQTKKAAQKKQATPVEHNDFDDYKVWLRQALADDANPSFYHTLKDWTGLPPNHQASFTAAVRAFWDAKNGEAAAYIELRNAASGVSALKQVKDVQQVTRMILRAAKEHRDDLAKALKVCHAAMQSTLLHLDALDTALATRPEGGLEERLQAFQRQLRKLSEGKKREIDSWMEVSEAFDVEMTDENIEDLKEFAELISNDLPKLKSSSIPVSDNDRSSSKRKRLEKAEGGSSKAQRKSAASDALRSKSVQAGAAQPQQPSAEEGRLDRAEEAISKPVPTFKAINKPHGRVTQPPGSPANPVNVQPHGPAAQPVARFEPLPFPAAGVMGPCAASLYRRHDEGGLQPSFVSWCRRQLASAAYATLEDAEPLCAAFVLFHNNTLPDHDWENEGDVPYLPFPTNGLQSLTCFSGDRLWPNVRRVIAMTKADDASAGLIEYVDRHLRKDGVLYVEANKYARDLIDLVQRRGPRHDWSRENDRFNLITSTNETKTIPLTELSWEGRWSFREVVGQGGYGRAILYFKYDSTGKILQRVVSKENYIGLRWNWSASWYGPDTNRIPIEAGMHRLLPKNRHIIEYLGFNLNKQLRMVRIYTAFAELGDLNNLYDNHARLRDDIDQQGNALVPELSVVAILYIFEAMAAGVCLMAHGALPDDRGKWDLAIGQANTPPPWGHNIVHRDIKPHNYFLSAPSESIVWPGLPVTALGDFGCAFDAADPRFTNDPRLTRGMGTPLWMAPEQHEDSPDLYAVTSATNVYQIGLSILQMMHLQVPARETNFSDPRRRTIFPGTAPLYPQRLVDLAWSCVALHPENRPSPEQVYRGVRKMAMSFMDYEGDGSHRIPWQFQRVPKNELVRTAPDNVLEALQRFTAEQKRERQDGVSNADKTSREWTKGLLAETRRRSDEIRRLWRLGQVWAQANLVQAQAEDRQSAQDEHPAQDEHLVQDWHLAQDQLPAQSRPNTRSEAEHDVEAAGPVDERTRADDEVEEDPEPNQRSDDDSEPRPRRSGKKKRSRGIDDEGARSDHSDVKRRPQGLTRRLKRRRPVTPVNVPEETPADDISPGDPPTPEPEEEEDPEEEFVTRWRDFLAEMNDQDTPEWEKLYLRARELFKHTQNAWFPEPEETSIDDRDELEKHVNALLEEAIGQEWQEHVDKIRANEHSLYHEGELQQAELVREVLMKRAREGQSPGLPPAPRTSAADDIAAGLGAHEEQTGWGPWQFFQDIGRGAQGTAALWTSAKFGDHGAIGKRIIVKDVDLKRHWAEESQWIKYDFTGNDRWIRERAMHAQLSSVGSAHNIVGYLGATTYTNKRSMRLYMEYCPHGDLAELLCKHAKFDRAERGLMLDDNDERVPKVKIPVRALWTIFRDLATAACIMHIGHNPFDSGAQEPADWTEIIHRDIKTGNIFLAAPLSKTGRGMPVCKLGEFGIAVPHEYCPLRNPEDMCRVGTNGWRAPEQQEYKDAEHRRKLSSATNIWAIGRVMLALVELTHGEWPKCLSHVLYGDRDNGRVSVNMDKKFDFLEDHGPMLYDIIADCLKPGPEDRVTAQDLLRRIHLHIDSPLVRLPELEEGDVLEYSHDLRWAS